MGIKKPFSRKPRTEYLNVDGTHYKTKLSNKFLKRTAWEQPDNKKLLSFIPGTVLKIYVEKGQTVKKGDKVMVLEAMKMQNKILIHCEGTIKNIHVKEGDKVPKGTLMLEMM